MFYSELTGGFYDVAIHGDNIPADAVEITKEQHAALLEGQSQGKVIVAGKGGKPELAEPAGPTPEEIAAAKDTAKRAAFTAESDPLFFKEQRGEVEPGTWLAKVAEIRARFA